MVPAAVELESPFMVQNLLVLTMLRCQLSFNAGDISLVGWPARCVWQGKNVVTMIASEGWLIEWQPGYDHHYTSSGVVRNR